MFPGYATHLLLKEHVPLVEFKECLNQLQNLRVVSYQAIRKPMRHANKCVNHFRAANSTHVNGVTLVMVQVVICMIMQDWELLQATVINLQAGVHILAQLLAIVDRIVGLLFL